MFAYTESLLLNGYLNDVDKQEAFEAYQEKERIYFELDDMVCSFHSEVPSKILKSYMLARTDYLQAKDILFGSDE